MIWLLACVQETGGRNNPQPDDIEIAPIPGFYEVSLAEEWEGDCNLDDFATYDEPEQEWEALPRGAVLILYQDYWAPNSCTLDGMDFSCDDGSWSESRAQVDKTIEGSFVLDGTLTGRKVVELDCGGSGCDILEEMFGNRLGVPCRIEAPFEGVLK